MSFTYEYLPIRGITKPTLEAYDVRTKVDADGRPTSIGFQYPDGRYKVRSLDEKTFRWEPQGSTGAAGLFGSNLFTPGAHKHVTITEGEFDALSLHQVLGGAVVSVQSASTALRDCTHSRSWLNSYERIYLAFDNDAIGRQATASVATLFEPSKVFDVKFSSRKDANAYLEAGEDTELRNIWGYAKKYLPEHIVSSLATFERDLDQDPVWGVPYPFKKLTEMTYGIRPGEIVLVTAQEKVGKTEFMHFLLHNLLKETTDAVGGLFNEETRRRTLQAICGVELGKPIHLPDSGITRAERTAALHSVVGRDDRLHMVGNAGNGDPETVLDDLRFLAAGCGCKYILWDHPGMSVFGVGGDKERLLLDTFAVRSALMVKELNFSLIVVSHVNDFGQTRGSRYLGKVCDLRIDLTRDTGASDPVRRNTVDITIPYGRYCSNSGPVGSYLFDPWTQKYTEVDKEQEQKEEALKLLAHIIKTGPIRGSSANDNDPHDPAIRTAA